ncbi:hypothetical protein Btru_012217 [Bulinus truncatus]|nr:hypothetical protein Btru_012217 [Bulinus truncatus]
MLEKLSYVTDNLGVKAIWLSSIFPHDTQAGDYGILDHKDIDPKLGVSLADFTDWIKKMRKEGKKVILDLIPNQTSKNHTWFKKFLNNEDLFKDYYIRGNNTPPSSQWRNYYKDKAWSNEKGVDYFHQFSEGHPDLNLRNDDVVNEIKEIMKFWFDAGVSGFYIRDLEYLIEDFGEVNGQFNSQDTFSFLEKLREVADQYSDKPGRERALFGSVTKADKNQTLEYGGTGEKKRLHIVVPDLKKLDSRCDASCAKDLVQKILLDNTNHWLGLQLTNENIGRVASRMDSSDKDLYKKRLMFAHAIQLLLPGTPINFYGDEFGQRNGPYNDSLDSPGREITLGPMQWNTQKCAGFTTGNETCKMDDKYKTDNVEAGFAHFAGLTPLESFIKFLELRGNESFQWGVTQVFNPQKDLLIFTRKAFRFPHFMVLINTGNDTIHVTPENVKLTGVKDVGIVRYHNREIDVNKNINVVDNAMYLSPYDIIVVEFPTDE